MAYEQKQPWWNPKYWSKRTWAIVVPAVIVVLIVVIVTPVKVAEANRYPNYTRLDYSLADTCEFEDLTYPLAKRLLGVYELADQVFFLLM